MDKIWKHITDSNVHNEISVISKDTKITKLVVWTPGDMFVDPIKRIYFTYHPLILETKNKKPDGLNSWLLVGYNKKYNTSNVNKDWTSLPTIDFLPSDKTLCNRTIIAGSAGSYHKIICMFIIYAQFMENNFFLSIQIVMSLRCSFKKNP
jgi:hypothetical protein